jgi:signal transduction histidine kinase
MATWSDAAAELSPLFADAAFELRFALRGGAAVRVAGGPVATRHAERRDPPAPWSARACCGEATGWLLAMRAPADPIAVRVVLERAVTRHTAVRLQRLAAVRAALTAELLERLTHRLRTDVSTLQAVAEGAATGLFDPDELAELPAELARTGAQAQRRLSAAREVMAAFAATAAPEPEPLLALLEDELGATAAPPPGERPLALVPGPGWAACARLLGEAFAGAPPEVTIAAHPDGWAIAVGGAGEPDPLLHLGLILAAAGGAAETAGGAGVNLLVPAAPSR